MKRSIFYLQLRDIWMHTKTIILSRGRCGGDGNGNGKKIIEFIKS